MGPLNRLYEAPEPGEWRGATPLLDIEDTRLRLRAKALTQLSRSERERVLAIYRFVKRIPFAKPAKLRLKTAREVLDAQRADAEDKASLFVALLRAAGFAARLRYVELHGDILRGLTTAIASAARPVVEVWMDGRWAATDTYIFDAAYMSAARRRLSREGWEWGFGLHLRGDGLWDGLNDAYLTGTEEMAAPVSLGVLGVFHDPLDYVRSDICKSRYPRVARAVRWGMVAPAIDKAVRQLRGDGGGFPPNVPQGKAI